MARERQAVSSNWPTPWKPEKEGEMLEGFYGGFQVVKGDRGETFKSHKIRPENSDNFMGVSGAMIDSKLTRIPNGTYVWITYLGTIKTNNGKAKDFSVECEKGTKLLDGSADDDVNF